MASLLCSQVWKVFREMSIFVRSLIYTINLMKRGLFVSWLKYTHKCPILMQSSRERYDMMRVIQKTLVTPPLLMHMFDSFYFKRLSRFALTRCIKSSFKLSKHLSFSLSNHSIYCSEVAFLRSSSPACSFFASFSQSPFRPPITISIDVSSIIFILLS